jgi:hypothetical protein
MKLGLSSLAVAAFSALLGLAGTPKPVVATAAHVCMDFPISRVGPECTARSPQKMGPCPVEGRTEFINVFRPGETITVRIRETINHPSHYRIAFNPEGDWFPDPTAIDDIDETKQHVLLDGIVDAEEAEQEVQITLPRITCENCTLQLIQVMYDKQGNGFGGANGGPNDNDDIYYSCADIALRGEPVAETSAARDEADGRSGARLLAVIAVIGVAGASIGSLRRVRDR